MKLFLSILAMVSGVALAQSPGTFTATAGMGTSRYFHTATLLQDGRVLIAGGQNDSQPSAPLSATEIYDPIARAFTPGPNMTVGRSGHTATLLPDGRVLMVGGDWNATSLLRIAASTAEIYDPSTGVFSATGSLPIARSGSNATLLANGKVLFTGGVTAENNTGFLIGDPELYDPSTGKFFTAGTYAGTLAGLNTNEFGFASSSTLLSDGTVLFATVPAAQVFDPVTGLFSLKGSLSLMYQSTGTIFQTDYIDGQSATLLLNGKVLVAGGEQEDTGRFASAQLYDPLTGLFGFTGSMTAARDNHSAVLFPDGHVLVTGGETQTCAGGGCFFSGTTTSAELYDPAQGAFTSAGAMTTSRAGHTTTLLNSGDVLLTGGYGYGGIGLYDGPWASAELFHPASPSPAPALFSIWHAILGQLVSPQSPAGAGEILSMYVSGLASGGTIPPQVAIGGQLAEIEFFGDAPGYPGYSQVNFRIPDSIASNSAIVVRLTYLGRSSNPMTVAVK